MDAELCSEVCNKCISSTRDCLQCQKATSACSLQLSPLTERQNLSTCEVSVILTTVQTDENSEHQYVSHITFQKLFEPPPDLYAFLVTINWVYIQSADLEVKRSQQKHGKQLWPSDVDDFISLIGFHWFS